MQYLPSILLSLTCCTFLTAAPTELVEQAPVSITSPDENIILVDFGKVAFGNLKITPPAGAKGEFKVHFGEAFEDGRINREPPGTVRYSMVTGKWAGGRPMEIAPEINPRNTQPGDKHDPPAIRTPEKWGVVTPFRWVEIEGWPGKLEAKDITRQAVFSADWDEDASAFESSDETLNRIWDLSKYSIKATTFAGVYVDGDRERIPYEADSYLNQLSHYYTDDDIQFARDTYDYLMKYATWPTEWASHMIFMAHADWMRTGDTEWLAPRYESLKSRLLMDRVGEDGLVKSNAAHIRKGDIVDWPTTERDGYVFTDTNTVVNAFHLKTFSQMADLATALGKTDEAEEYAALYETVGKTFQKKLFDEKTGLYRDGIGTDHSSIHANFFPLAFGLVPEDKKAGVLDFLEKSGMKCSVYAAQYLMEALFDNGAEDKALELILADGDRSWKHMVNSGTTISWEAWDQKYKPNQDWNHAWGAAPANLLPRFVLGVEVLAPGWKQVRIRPNPGNLAFAKGKIPTPRGSIEVRWENKPSFKMRLSLPDGMSARLELPASANSNGVAINGQPTPAKRVGSRWIVNESVSGRVNITVDCLETTAFQKIEAGDATREKQAPSSQDVLQKLELVNRRFTEKYPDPAVIEGGPELKHKKFPSSYWGGGVYYAGLMALYSIDPKEAYLKQAIAFGEANHWRLNTYRVGNYSEFSDNANNHIAGQTYIELYQLDPKPERIEAIKKCLDQIVNTPLPAAKSENPNWFWVDALFMSMPTFAKLGVLEKDDKYFDKMHEMYLLAKNEIGGGLYNTKDCLWWRDSDFVPPYKEPNGENCYWSRGNGWVYGALTRVLEELSQDNKYRAEYLKTYKEMSAALLKVQRDDGLWNVSLHDPNNFGGKELTGTSLFTYGFAWGVNHKVLDEGTYAPAVLKAWHGMAECVHPNGFLGFVQGSGKEPKSSQPVGYDREPDLEDYGIGCFLLGGSEVYRYLAAQERKPTSQ